MRVGVWSAVLVWLTLGCAGSPLGEMIPTSGGYEARLATFVGQAINVAVRELGAPTRTVDLAAGSRLYVWEELSELRTPFRGQEKYNPQTGAEEFVMTPSQRVPLDCFTELETNAYGIVTRTRAEGIACIALPPSSAASAGAPPVTPAVPAVPVVAPAALAPTEADVREATAAPADDGSTDAANAADAADAADAGDAADAAADPTGEARRQARRERRTAEMEARRARRQGAQ